MMLFTAFYLSLHLLGADAQVIAIQGKASWAFDGQTRAIERFTKLPVGSQVETEANTRVKIRLESGSTLFLGERTKFKVLQLDNLDPASRRKERFGVSLGKIWAKVRGLFGAESTFTIESNNAVAGVRGTSFVFETDGKNDKVTMVEGEVELRIDSEILLLTGFGTTGEVQNGKLSLGEPQSSKSLNQILNDFDPTRKTNEVESSETKTEQKRRKDARDLLVPPNDLSDVDGDFIEGESPPEPGNNVEVDIIIELPDEGTENPRQ